MKPKALYGIRVSYQNITTSGNVVFRSLRNAKALAKKRISEYPNLFLEVIERPLCYNGEYLSEEEGNVIATFVGQILSVR